MEITLLSAHECFDDLAQRIASELEKTHVDIVEAVKMSPNRKAQLSITVALEFAPNTHQFTISSVVTPVMPSFRHKVTCQGDDKNQIQLAIKTTGTTVAPPEGEPIDEGDDEPETSAATTSVSPIAGAQEVRKADGPKRRGRPRKDAAVAPTAAAAPDPATASEADAGIWPAEPFKESFAAAPAPPVAPIAPPADSDVPPED